jgi:ABC-type oligopeptide transport system substrate-binding subunit
MTMIVSANRVRLIAALGCVLLVACSVRSETPKPSPSLATDQTLRFPIARDFATLDPAMIESKGDAAVAQNLFNGLLALDKDMNVVPDIATSMPTVSPDGLIYTFHLRKDVTFSNSDKVTSNDVLYSWDRAAAMQGPYASNLAAIAGYDSVASNQVVGAALEALLEKKDRSVTLSGLSAPDDYTIVVKLSTASGWFVPAIAQAGVVGMIVDQNVVKADFENWWNKPQNLIGTGAFKMSARTPGQSAEFVPVTGWWGTRKPTLAKVNVDVVADPKAAIARYEQGAFDLFGYAAYMAPVDELARVRSIASERSQLVIQPSNKTYWVTFNMVADASRAAGGPFTLDQGKASHDLRLAFALAIDKAKLVKDACGDVACMLATGGLVPKGLLGNLGDGADPLAAFDPAKARSLLASADPNGSKTKGLVYAYDPENPLNEPAAKSLQSQWLSNLGITVKTQPIQSSNFINDRLKGAYVLSRDSWAAGYNDPQAWFDNLWGETAGCPDAFCSSGYDTKAYDQLLAKADAQRLTDAMPDYKALSHQLIDDVVYIPLYYATSVLLIKPYVRGAGANNLSDLPWSGIEIVAH